MGNRRNFLKNAIFGAMAVPLMSHKLFAEGQSSASALTNELIKPRALRPGDIVGVIAPGTAVSDPEEISKAQEVLNHFGLKIKFGKYIANGHGYKSRTVEQRLDDLHSMFIDPEVKAVICIRGGYGSPQLLDGIDYDLIRKNPKIFLGYSDITAMLLAIHKYSKLITFHGPMLLAPFTEYTTNYLQRAIFQTNPIGLAVNADARNAFRKLYPTRTVSSGTARGKLIGGNLSLITSTMSTPYEIDTEGKILFMEDVGEQPYRIDRMLTHLRLAGKLDKAKGIIFGYCANCEQNGSKTWDYSLGEIIDNILGKLNIPVLFGLTIGHTSNQITLPIGVDAELNADTGELNILESGVV